MKRRDVLKAGALTGVAGAIGAENAGCGPGLLGMSRVVAAEVDGFVRQVDRVSDWLDDTEMLKLVPRPEGTDADAVARRADIDARAALLGKTFRSLHVAGSFLGLSEDAAMHPVVQRRVARQLPEMDEALFGVVDLVKSADDEERAEVQRILEENPNLPDQFAETISRRAREAGVELGPRMQLRSMMARATWRLRKQPITVVMDEYVDTVERLTATLSEPERARAALRSRLTGRMLWEFDTGPAAGATLIASTDARRSCLKDTDCPDDHTCVVDACVSSSHSASAPRPHYMARSSGGGTHWALWVGAFLVGIGAVTGLAGAVVLANGGFPGVFAITAGAVMFVVGIPFLIVGTVNTARRKRRW